MLVYLYLDSTVVGRSLGHVAAMVLTSFFRSYRQQWPRAQFTQFCKENVMSGPKISKIELINNGTRLHYWFENTFGSEAVLTLHMPDVAPDGSWVDVDVTTVTGVSGFVSYGKPVTVPPGTVRVSMQGKLKGQCDSIQVNATLEIDAVKLGGGYLKL